MTQLELYHYGVKNMKWGERRFQNEDGSLTEEGKRRYGVEGLKTDGGRGAIGTIIGTDRLKNSNDNKKIEKQVKKDFKKAYYDSRIIMRSKDHKRIKSYEKAKAFVEDKYGKETVENILKKSDPIKTREKVADVIKVVGPIAITIASVAANSYDESKRRNSLPPS